jgi:hypothetical protein
LIKLHALYSILVEGRMGLGVDAVRQQIRADFGDVRLTELQDEHTLSTIFFFTVDGENFTVQVSSEFDEDYVRGIAAPFHDLGTLLKLSMAGTVSVTRWGVGIPILKWHAGMPSANRGPNS